MRSSQATIAIRHSQQRTSWPRVESRGLVDVMMVPVVAPVLPLEAGPLEKPVDLLQYPLIHEENRDLWQSWFEAAQIAHQVERGIVYPDSALVLQAVLRGQGVGLLDEFFVRDDIAAGRLVRPFALPIAHGAYWIFARSFSRLSDAGVTFVHWLQSKMNANIHGEEGISPVM